MAHCKKHELADLKNLLQEIRSWDKIKEKGHGIFYLKAAGFLHFHSKGGKRWADIRDGESWGTPVALPFGASSAQIKDFLLKTRRRYQRVLGIGAAKRHRCGVGA